MGATLCLTRNNTNVVGLAYREYYLSCAQRRASLWQYAIPIKVSSLGNIYFASSLALIELHLYQLCSTHQPRH